MSPSQLPAHWKLAEFRVADPGASGIIDSGPIGNFMVELRTAGAEARTLLGPDHAGDEATLVLQTDGGDCTVTVKDSAGNTTHTLVLNDAGDMVVLKAVRSGTTRVWKIMCYNGLGAALTTQLTEITIEDANGSPDYAIQSFTNSSAWGFAAEAELISFAYVVQNLQVRVAELEAIVEAAGLAKAN